MRIFMCFERRIRRSEISGISYGNKDASYAMEFSPKLFYLTFCLQHPLLCADKDFLVEQIYFSQISQVY